MPYLNKVVLVGHATRDMEMKYTASSMAIGSFGIAINKGSGEKKKAFFFEVVCFGKTAEWNEDHVKKGAAVIIDGELSQDTWEDKNTGAKRSAVKVIANTVGVFKKAEPVTPLEQDLFPVEQPVRNYAVTDDDDVPF